MLGRARALRQFCVGVGEARPDIAAVERRIQPKEMRACSENGVADVLEIELGRQAVLVVRSREAETGRPALTLRDAFLALAHDEPTGACEKPDAGPMTANPYNTRKEVNPELPDVRIEVLGPPATSGTRDAFVELAKEGGRKTFPDIKAMRKAYRKLCHTIREDGAYIEAGENDNLIAQKLTANPRALRIMGMAVFDRRAEAALRPVNIDGVVPNVGNYPVSRALTDLICEEAACRAGSGAWRVNRIPSRGRGRAMGVWWPRIVADVRSRTQDLARGTLPAGFS